MLYPLTEEDVDNAFKKSEGVPREAIRYIIPRLESILFEREEEEPEPQSDYVIKLTPTVVLGAVVKGLSLSAERHGATVRLHMASGGTQKQSAAIAILEKDDKTINIGVDVPNVKDWDRSGGVAAFYSAKRLKDALDSKEVEYAIISVPEGTSGAKYESKTKDMADSISVLELNNEKGKLLVESTNNDSLASDFESFFSFILGRILS